ncbi:MAG: NADPH:quinone oxidoreductase family protein [Pseudomonadota bacterium]
MRALVCKKFGPTSALSLDTLDRPEPGPGEVLIEVRAAGINFPDLLTVEGKYQMKPPLPFTPGVECSGLVAALGEGVKGLSVGDKVIATPQIGAFAEHCVVPAMMVMPMGKSMSFEQAAGFAITYGTSYYALKQRANLQAGESVLVLGAAGGVGIATIQLAKQMGATVIAAASSEEKLDFACSAGADERINYVTEDLKARTKELTGGNGANVIYDPVGGELAEAAFRSIAWDGRFLVIGFASGPIPKMPLNLALLKGASLVGVFWGSWLARFPAEGLQNFRELIGMIDSGKFSPLVSDVFPLSQHDEAFRQIAERRVKGKVILSMD